MRGVFKISMMPALPNFVVVTLHVADPGPVPAFITVRVTARPPGADTADESDPVNGPTPFDEAPASAARISTAAPMPRNTVPCAWLADGCARPSGLHVSQRATSSVTGAPQRTHAWCVDERDELMCTSSQSGKEFGEFGHIGRAAERNDCDIGAVPRPFG